MFSTNLKPNIFLDLRGTPCPMNFVKTKIRLEKMAIGEILEIWIDDGEPIESVPKSVIEEGHKVLSQKKMENYYKVCIEKV